MVTRARQRGLDGSWLESACSRSVGQPAARGSPRERRPASLEWCRIVSDQPSSELPREVRAFLHSCIESIEQLEILMLLRGSQEGRTAREVAAVLRVPTARARHDLEILTARGLLDVRVAEETSYRYGPKTSDLGRYCDLLAEYYVTARQTVFGFIASESRLSIKRFADAFKLRDPET
jgi:hypothetical protein